MRQIESKEVIFDIENLCTYFHGRRNNVVRAVDNVSLKVYNGETLGIVGESGCGKSTLGKSIMSLEKPTSGKIFYNYEGQQKDITQFSKKELFEVRKKVQMVFQEYMIHFMNL